MKISQREPSPSSPSEQLWKVLALSTAGLAKRDAMLGGYMYFLCMYFFEGLVFAHNLCRVVSNCSLNLQIRLYICFSWYSSFEEIMLLYFHNNIRISMSSLFKSQELSERRSLLLIRSEIITVCVSVLYLGDIFLL